MVEIGGAGNNIAVSRVGSAAAWCRLVLVDCGRGGEREDDETDEATNHPSGRFTDCKLTERPQHQTTACLLPVCLMTDLLLNGVNFFRHCVDIAEHAENAALRLQKQLRQLFNVLDASGVVQLQRNKSNTTGTAQGGTHTTTQPRTTTHGQPRIGNSSPYTQHTDRHNTTPDTGTDTTPDTGTDTRRPEPNGPTLINRSANVGCSPGRKTA